MSNIRFDYSGALSFVGQHEIDYMAEYVKSAHDMLHKGTGAGNDFLGWVDLPVNYDKEEFERIKKAAEKIRSNSDALIVIGIGGSYLGARAAVEMLQHCICRSLSTNCTDFQHHPCRSFSTTKFFLRACLTYEADS